MIAINIFGSQFTIADASTIEHHNTAADHVMLMDVGHDEFTLFFREYFQQHLDFAANGRLKAYKPDRNEPVDMMANAMLRFGQLWVPADRKTRSIAGPTPAERAKKETKESAALAEQLIIAKLSQLGPLTMGILINRLKSISRATVEDAINRMVHENRLYIARHINPANSRKVLTVHISK